MSTIVTRNALSVPLTWTQMDANFTNLNNDKLEKSGGTMTGELTFSDTSEGVTFSNGTRHYDINASNIHAAEFGATNTAYGFYKNGNLRGLVYAPATYSTYLGIGTTTNRTWSNTLQDTFGFATGPNGETSLVNNAGTISFFGHGTYIGSDYNFKYTTTGGVTPAMIKMSGGQISFWTCTSTGTAGNTVTFLNPLMIDSAGGSAGSVSLLSGQLKFPATQIASADANTLDDYEEGTWTPTVTAGSGSITTYTSSGKYTKIGNVVHATLDITVSNKGTAGGAMVATLPFSSNASTGAGAAGCEVAVAGFCLASWVPPSTGSVQNIKYDGTSPFTVNGTRFLITATYLV